MLWDLTQCVKSHKLKKFGLKIEMWDLTHCVKSHKLQKFGLKIEMWEMKMENKKIKIKCRN